MTDLELHLSAPFTHATLPSLLLAKHKMKRLAVRWLHYNRFPVQVDTVGRVPCHMRETRGAADIGHPGVIVCYCSEGLIASLVCVHASSFVARDLILLHWRQSYSQGYVLVETHQHTPNHLHLCRYENCACDIGTAVSSES